MHDIAAKAVQTIAFDRASQGDAGQESTTKVWYQAPEGKFVAGFWAAQPTGPIAVAYSKDEICFLLEGTARLTSADGTEATYTAGETFLIPSGFSGTWETVAPVRKFFAVYTKVS